MRFVLIEVYSISIRSFLLYEKTLPVYPSNISLVYIHFAILFPLS
jgi:hypothetical protein